MLPIEAYSSNQSSGLHEISFSFKQKWQVLMPIRELNDAIKVVHSTKVRKDNDEKNNINDGKVDRDRAQI